MMITATEKKKKIEHGVYNYGSIVVELDAESFFS